MHFYDSFASAQNEALTKKEEKGRKRGAHYHTLWRVTHCPVILSDLFKPHLRVCISQGILSSET